jgi:hypothetical protein
VRHPDGDQKLTGRLHTANRIRGERRDGASPIDEPASRFVGLYPGDNPGKFVFDINHDRCQVAGREIRTEHVEPKMIAVSRQHAGVDAANMGATGNEAPEAAPCRNRSIIVQGIGVLKKLCASNQLGCVQGERPSDSIADAQYKMTHVASTLTASNQLRWVSTQWHLQR